MLANERNEADKRLASILSVIWPGMGLIYRAKWSLGMVFVIIHVLSALWAIKNVFFYSGDNTIFHEVALMISLGLVIVNWLVSLAVTNSDK